MLALCVFLSMRRLQTTCWGLGHDCLGVSTNFHIQCTCRTFINSRWRDPWGWYYSLQILQSKMRNGLIMERRHVEDRGWFCWSKWGPFRKRNGLFIPKKWCKFHQTCLDSSQMFRSDRIGLFIDRNRPASCLDTPTCRLVAPVTFLCRIKLCTRLA